MVARTRWLLLAVVVVAVVAALFFWRGRRLDPLADPNSDRTFTVSDVPVESPELSIDVGTVRWTHHPDYTDWACLIECRERDGCHAEVQLVVDYISLGKKQRLTLGGRLDAAYGETSRIGRAQRPPVKVDRVERVTVEVLEAFRRGAPTPTPME
jgi:hypothetical protein